MEQEQIKERAKILFKNNLETFIVDIYDNWFFCKIISISEDIIKIKHQEGKEEDLLFLDIVRIEKRRAKE